MGKRKTKEKAAFLASLARQTPTTFSTKKRLDVLRKDPKALKYSESEARDDHGRWSASDGTSYATEGEARAHSDGLTTRQMERLTRDSLPGLSSSSERLLHESARRSVGDHLSHQLNTLPHHERQAFIAGYGRPQEETVAARQDMASRTLTADDLTIGAVD